MLEEKVSLSNSEQVVILCNLLEKFSGNYLVEKTKESTKITSNIFSLGKFELLYYPKLKTCVMATMSLNGQDYVYLYGECVNEVAVKVLNEAVARIHKNLTNVIELSKNISSIKFIKISSGQVLN